MKGFLTTILFLTTLTLLSSCEPRLHGNLKVYNQSNLPLTIYTSDNNSFSYNTDSFIISPNSSGTIKILEGRTGNHAFTCCPCEFDTLVIKTSNGNIKKDPSLKDNWSIPNQKKLRKFSGPDVMCEFHVTQSDI